MIATIIIVSIAFGWLGFETKWLTVRLPIGGKPVNKTLNAESSKDRTAGFEPENVGLIPTSATKADTPYYWKSPEDKQTHLNLCVGCRLKCQEHKTERWCGWKLPAKSIKAFNSTLNLNEGCNIWRAKFLKQVAREVKRKTTVSSGLSPLPAFIKTVRIGSHQEWIETTPKHGYHRIVEEYTTHYNDCLVPKSWLKKHEHDTLPEPTIEISADGKNLSVNGNYKVGVIKEFVKANRSEAVKSRRSVVKI